MRFKPGIVLSIRPAMARALPKIDEAHADAEIPRDAIVTSGAEGAHSWDSLHFEACAIDLRSNDLAPRQKEALKLALRKRLNGDESKDRPYQVVVEADHFHVEYQPFPGWRPSL